MEERLRKEEEAEEVHLKMVKEGEEAHWKRVEEVEGEHWKRATEVEEGHLIEAMAVAEEHSTVVEAEEGVHCLSKEVEEQDVKRQAAMVVQMVSWEAKEVEAHSREEQHEHVLWSLFAESLVEEVAEELHLWQVSAEEPASFGP